MGERNFRKQYEVSRAYADQQAVKLQRGERIVQWTYEAEPTEKQPKPKKVVLKGAAWVARSYEVAADDARLAGMIEEQRACLRLVEEYKQR